jgi:RNA polymerase sigma-70 factor (ECF subfamily)
MPRRGPTGGVDSIVSGARAGDLGALNALIRRHERELLVHCYRLLGSLQDAEDALRETLLRASRHLDGFEGRSTVRAWLYGIAINVCLDVLGRASRRVLPHGLSPASDPSIYLRPREDIAWLEPFPTSLLEAAAPADEERGTCPP